MPLPILNIRDESGNLVQSIDTNNPQAVDEALIEKGIDPYQVRSQSNARRMKDNPSLFSNIPRASGSVSFGTDQSRVFLWFGVAVAVIVAFIQIFKKK